MTLAILAVGVFIIGSKEYLFRSTYRLKAQFDEVAGLAAGADVQVGGVHSGIVHSIDLPHKPGDRITVLMDMDNSTHEIIKRDSVATIETAGVLGNQYLAITFGSSGQAEVKDGEIIHSDPPLAIADLLKKTNGILNDSQQAIQNVAQTTAHLNSVSAKIDSGKGTVGLLINNKDMYNNLEQTAAMMQSTMLQAQTGVTDFQENMEALKHNFFLSGYFRKRGYEDSADLTLNRIGVIPEGVPIKSFVFSSRQLFDARDSARLKNQRILNAVGEYLAQHSFGVAVVVSTAGAEGDSHKELVLSEARAMVVREYLVENYGFDDRKLRTMGAGKQVGADMVPNPDADWGSMQIIIFPSGTEETPETGQPPGISSMHSAPPTTQPNETSTQKP
jgi:phospholipid/cholesterol/gamma-HCH transport system substrate-binding protein